MNQNQTVTNRIRIGTRGSKLALWQANFVKGEIENHFPSIQVTCDVIQTHGDRDQVSSLTKIGGMGLFTKAIEQALIDNKIDLAVHSLKDLPSDMADILRLGAVPVRGEVADAFIGLEDSDFYRLPWGATIMSGSIRRRAQILSIRPDIRFTDLRGNIETRLSKLRQYRFDGIIMAEAALVRLSLNDINYYRFSLDEMLPAVGQGAIGIQVRIQDRHLQPILDKLNDLDSSWCVSAERAFLKRLDSGCQFPVAAFAEIKKDKLSLRGLAVSMDGQTTLKDTLSGSATEAEHIGSSLAEKLIERGATQLIEQV
jgi:hydroxymethylbilane synthase